LDVKAGFAFDRSEVDSRGRIDGSDDAAVAHEVLEARDIDGVDHIELGELVHAGGTPHV
jgi:hypothetical protein